MAKLIDITGKAISGEWGTDDQSGEGVPVLRTTNFTNLGVINYSNIVTRIIPKNKLQQKCLRHGDIIIEKSGGSDKQPVGRVVYFDGEEEKYLFNNFTGVLRVADTKKWFPKYVFYALFSNYLKGGTRSFENKTTGLHNLKTDSYVTSFDITFRNISEQREICTILDRICNLINLRDRQLAKLDLLVKSRFVEMFGNVESNNKGWQMAYLCDLCSVSSSKRIYQSELSSHGVPFLRISDLTNLISTGLLTADLHISNERYIELIEQGQVPIAGDILITSRGTLGQCYIVKDDDKFYFQDGMISWLSKYNNSIMPLFIVQLFSMPEFRRQIDSMQAGTTVAYLSIAMLKRLKVVIPDIEIQNHFASFVSHIDKSKVSMHLRSRTSCAPF